jgi:hypothetical protein
VNLQSLWALTIIFLEEFKMRTVKHISGVFLCIAEKATKPESPNSKTRIFVLEQSTGHLLHGLLPTKIVRSLSLRDYISFDIEDWEVTTPEKVFGATHYYDQTEDVYKDKVDKSLLC